MSEQLNIDFTANTSQMVSQVQGGIGQVEAKFKAMDSRVRSNLGVPIQMSLDLDTAIAQANAEKLLKVEKQINLEGRKKEKTNQLMKRFAANTKVTAQQLKNARDKMVQLRQSVEKGSEAAKRLEQGIAKANERLQAMKSAGSGATSGLNQGLTSIIPKFTAANVAANLLTQAINAIGRAGTGFLKTAADMEVLQLQLTAFTGSAAAAEAAFNEFVRIAAYTPFNLESVAQAGKTMMAFGLDTQSAIQATEQLAKAAAATGGDLNNLARNLGQISAQGQAYTRDLTQFAMQGLPIWDEMAKITGKNVTQLKKMASEGQISFGLVSQAIANMTAEGTAFDQTAQRMSDTFIGKIAMIESEWQKMSLSFIQAVNNLDVALGGTLKGSIEAVIGVIKNMSDNMDTIVAAAASLAAAVAAYGAVQAAVFIQGLGVKVATAVGAALGYFTLLSAKYGTMTAAILLAFKAKAALMALLNPVAIAGAFAAVAAGVAVYNTLKGSMQEAAAEAKALVLEQTESLNKTSEASAALGMTYDMLKERIGDALGPETIDRLKSQETALLNAKQELAELNSKYNEKKQAIQDALRTFQDSINKEIEGHNKVISKLRDQIDVIRQKGPAQRALDELNRQELEYTAQTGKELKGHITEGEKKKLQARAQLEALDKQKKVEEKQKKIQEEQKKINQLKLELQREQKDAADQLLELAKERKTKEEELKTTIEGLETSIKNLADSIRDSMNQEFTNSAEEAGKIKKNVDPAKQATQELAGKARDVANNFAAANTQLDIMATKIRNMPTIKAGSKPAFAGGPVSSGETRTVNELGKEAFLSASGRLSMINAPAWGEWKAPSSGTIIPAHLTKQLNIPTGGINLNKVPGGGANVGKAVRTVKAAAGDTFNQSVTIQSANPVQAANNMMVEMTRLRRRRFG